MPRLRLAPQLVTVVVVVALTGCTSGDATSEPTTTAPGGASMPATSAGVDPLVPYSPATTPFVERTSGFIPDTLTLPVEGGGVLHVTPVTTTMTVEYVDGARSLAVYVTLENPGDAPWTGRVGANAQITDEAGATFSAVPPRPGDLHPHPEQYGGSNRTLVHAVTVPPGGTLRGALVFHPTGGNRPITLRISLDGATTWGEWQTNLGVF
jgi:hypothetical protein